METLLKHEQARQESELRRKFQLQELVKMQHCDTKPKTMVRQVDHEIRTLRHFQYEQPIKQENLIYGATPFAQKYNNNNNNNLSTLTHKHCDVTTPTNSPVNYSTNGNRYPPTLEHVTMETSYYNQQYGYHHQQPWVNTNDRGYGRQSCNTPTIVPSMVARTRESDDNLQQPLQNTTTYLRHM